MTMLHHAVPGIGFAILGSCLGSFLNVCAYRIPRRISLVHPRSHCPRCGAGILTRDNVPVLSWLALRGRCRVCRCAIPLRYVAVEVAVAMLFVVPYFAMAALVGGIPWERIGTGWFFAILLASWTVTLLIVFAIAADRVVGRSFRVTLSEARRRAAGRSEGPTPIDPAS
jgi:prepilin signal peptidase PulO-like enzyme (type II secretory pathway)